MRCWPLLLHLELSKQKLLRLLAAANVRFGSKADIGARPIDVRFTPKSGH
jgi:hypothetical protein